MAYDYQDPFASGLEQGNSAMLRSAGQEGFFDPRGSSRFKMAMRRRLLTQGRSRAQRANTMSRLAGLDSIGQRQALVDTGQDVAGTTSDALNNFDVGDYQQNRDYFRGLYGNALQRTRDLEDQRRAERQSFLGGIGQFAGQAGMAYLTGGASPPGTAGRRRMQRRNDVGPYTQDYYNGR